MSAINQIPDQTEELHDLLVDKRRKGAPQASTQRRIAGRLLQTLRAQAPLATQKLQEVATNSSRESAAAQSAIQSATTLFNDRSKHTDAALAAFEKDLESTTLGQYTMSHLTGSFANLSLSQKPAQPQQIPFMATAERGEAALHAVGTAMKWTAKKALGCDSFPTKELNACRSTLELAKTIGKAALGCVGLKEPVKKMVVLLDTPLQTLAQGLESPGNSSNVEMTRDTSNSSNRFFSLRLLHVLEKMGRALAGDLEPESVRKMHALLLTASDDYNGALSQSSAYVTYLQIKYLFQATHAKVSNISSFCQAIDRETAENGPVDVLIVQAHGEQGRMRFSRAEGIAVGDPLPTRSCLKNLPTHATIVLDSCSTGQGREHEPNIANYLAKETHEDTRIISPERNFTYLQMMEPDPTVDAFYVNNNHKEIVPTYLIDKEVRKKGIVTEPIFDGLKPIPAYLIDKGVRQEGVKNESEKRDDYIDDLLRHE